MLKTLIKKQLLEVFQTYYVNNKTGKARSKKGTALFFVLLAVLFVILGLAFYAMGSGLGAIMLGHGFNWLYFALMGLLAIALGVFGSVFNTYAGVYLPKDNELLMALPIPNRTLLLARLSGVYVTSLMYSAWIWIPVLIAYWVIVPLSVLNVIFPILLTFIIALFVSVLSCVLGWVVAIIAAKAKGKSFLTVFLSIMFVAIYYVVYFKIVNSLSEIVNHLDTLGSAVRSWLHYSYLLGTAADGNVISMLLITLITVLLAVLCVFVLSRSFAKLALAEGKSERKKLKKDAYKQRSAKTAMLKREYKHFSSVSTWMLNGGFGLLILLIAAAAILIKSGAVRAFMPEIAPELPELYAALPVFLLSAVCVVISINAISPVSVSIEGKSLWILQTLPVEPWQILRAKEKMDSQLNCVSALLFAVAAGFVLEFQIIEIILIVCAVLAFVELMADFGLFLNLRHPNLNWSNAASLTKQSMAVVVVMFGGWAFSAALGFGGLYLCRLFDVRLVLAGYTVLFSALWLMLRRWLKSKGTVILSTLS